ncbi:hypothetical protein DQ04_11491000 [Trypanosoma grayi]|uniref:hypothetical protein n=1 Tax=Trypanosoma grayi TaxID=71804 RepID=UPI0004F49864|nr:hypothetical protein DQ04_11491000 [Trypanosoma grayi]KEG06957.1 hypothetical protein DQ04_11491000 [Trypanosoma grayi]
MRSPHGARYLYVLTAAAAAAGARPPPFSRKDSHSRNGYRHYWSDGGGGLSYGCVGHMDQSCGYKCKGTSGCRIILAAAAAASPPAGKTAKEEEEQQQQEEEEEEMWGACECMPLLFCFPTLSALRPTLCTTSPQSRLRAPHCSPS